MRKGASKEAWAALTKLIGSADLLPVVANLEATISPQSSLKSLGKTPSRYNKAGLAVGIKEWTEYTAGSEDVLAWSKQPDYGICIQSRNVRAADIDVPDLTLSMAIAMDFLQALGRDDIPVRWRENSGKCLYAMRIEGDLRKRVFKVEGGGIVEFLATGQQFVAVGQHPSGARLLWNDEAEYPDDIPTVALEDFERAWATIRDKFGVPDSERRNLVRVGSGEISSDDDPVASWLEAEWEHHGFNNAGDALYIECPWKDGHSGDSGESQTAWMVAGTHGYQQGHFKCQHASCMERTDHEFKDVTGYAASDFDDETQTTVLVVDPKTGEGRQEQPKLPLPGFKRDKQGSIEPELPNVVKAVSSIAACGAQIRFDTFRAELMIEWQDERVDGKPAWRALKDADAVELRLQLMDIGFKPVGVEAMRDALMVVGERQQFDTAQVWLEGLPPWDGVKRVERLWPDYFRTDNTAYTRAVGLYIMTAQAGRIMAPGAKADMVPVLVSDEGYLKSTGVAALAPGPEFFSEFNLEEKDADLSRKMRGCLVGELNELRGLSGRGAEANKAWITRDHEEWTPKYREYTTRFPRRLLFHGTSNNTGFMADDIGKRRWLPGHVRALVDVAAIRRDRDQLWAEGLALWRSVGIMWQDAERLAKAEHAEFQAQDTWADIVSSWLDTDDDIDGCPRTEPFTMRDALNAVNVDASKINRNIEMRMANVLVGCGMERHKIWVKALKRTDWRWVGASHSSHSSHNSPTSEMGRGG